MIRRDKWWVREIERIQRAHREERAELIRAIAHLSDRPLPDRGWDSWAGDDDAQPDTAAISDPDQMI